MTSHENIYLNSAGGDDKEIADKLDEIISSQAVNVI
jgi:hypothetical protein